MQTNSEEERKPFCSEYIGDIEPSAHIKIQQYDKKNKKLILFWDKKMIPSAEKLWNQIKLLKNRILFCQKYSLFFFLYFVACDYMHTSVFCLQFHISQRFRCSLFLLFGFLHLLFNCFFFLVNSFILVLFCFALLVDGIFSSL